MIKKSDLEKSLVLAQKLSETLQLCEDLLYEIVNTSQVIETTNSWYSFTCKLEDFETSVSEKILKHRLFLETNEHWLVEEG